MSALTWTWKSNASARHCVFARQDGRVPVFSTGSRFAPDFLAEGRGEQEQAERDTL